MNNGRNVQKPDEEKVAGAFRQNREFLSRFLAAVFRESRQDMIPFRAAGLTYATMLTLVPVLIIVFNLFQLFGGADWFSTTVRPFILDNLAPGTGAEVAARLEEIIDNAGGFALNGIGVIVLVLAVWSIFSGIEGTVNAIWGTRSSAGSLKRLPLYWGLITIVPILLVSSLALTTYIQALPIISEAVEEIGIVQKLLNRAVTAGMIIIGLFLLYQFVPNTRVRPRFALASAVIAGLIYEIFKSAIIFYTTNLVKNDLIYGSLAAIPLLLIWVNLSWVIILAGVEMTFVQQHYAILASQSKGVRLSRTQRNVLGYLILYEATKVFRGDRGRGARMNPVQWADRYGIPPGLVEVTVEKLQQGGLVERVGTPPDEIVLVRSPEQIGIAGVEALLMSETTSEWEWPELTQWQWMKRWMEVRRQAWLAAGEARTIADLEAEMDAMQPFRERAR